MASGVANCSIPKRRATGEVSCETTMGQSGSKGCDGCRGQRNTTCIDRWLSRRPIASPLAKPSRQSMPFGPEFDIGCGPEPFSKAATVPHQLCHRAQHEAWIESGSGLDLSGFAPIDFVFPIFANEGCFATCTDAPEVTASPVQHRIAQHRTFEKGPVRLLRWWGRLSKLAGYPRGCRTCSTPSEPDRGPRC